MRRLLNLKRPGVLRAAALLVPALLVGPPALAADEAAPAAEPASPADVSGEAVRMQTPAATPAERPAEEPADKPPPKDADRFEGAVGLILTHKPSYPGASDFKVSVNPAGFLRWGRITITGAGGFTTRRKDDVERGLGAELLRREGIKVSLNLRYDNGRSEGDSPNLAGMGDIKRTVRARLSARWRIDPNWQFTAGASTDTLNRAGGYIVDAGLTREWRLGPQTTWQMGVGLTAASDRYMQAWFGVTPEQSVRSGHPVYITPEGLHLRDIGIGGTLRTEFSSRWGWFGGFGYGRLVGPAADSPLTGQRGALTLSSGLVWRF